MNWLNGIIRFSLKNRVLVLLGAALVLIGGWWSAGRMDVDVFPDLTAPTVVVMSDARGMAAEEVERLVSFPIETAVNGATSVRRVRSSSMYGYSFVWVEFDWGMDVFRARQIVSEKMLTLGESLPEGITPVLAPQSSVMGEIMFIGLQSETTSMMDLHTLAEWVVQPAILATGGVSQVTVIGGENKEYQIVADPVRMAARGIRLCDVEAVGRSLSENSEGGILRERGNEYALRGVARTTDLDALADSYVGSCDGVPVRLGDVADIRVGSSVPLGHASHNARPAVILSVSKQPNINTLKVTRSIEQNLAGIAEALPADVKMDTHVFRQADFIQAAVSNVGEALLEGAVFVILILFLFLGNLRTTSISIFAIPLSLLGTCIVLRLLGMDINTMTLGGMCIAIGSLVDDAIIDVENVYKRLRQNHLLPPERRRPVFDVVFEASSEIRASVINATLIIVAAFMPLFFLSGMEGRMLKPLGVTFLVSLLTSLVVAMTVTPLLCRLMLTDEKYLARNDKEAFVSRVLGAGYRRSLSWVLSHRKLVIGGTLVLLLAAAGTYFTLGHGFLPDFNEGAMTITAVTRPGVSLEVSDELGNLMERELLAIPEVTSTSRRTGRGDLDEHSQATNGAEIDVNFRLQGRGHRSKTELFDEVRARLGALPGVAVTVGQPLSHRIDHILSGTQAAIVIKLFGTELGTMQTLGGRIKDCIGGIDGLVDVNVEQQTDTPQIQIRPDRAALTQYGISVADFNEFVGLAFSGEKLSDIYEGQRRFDVVMRLPDRYREGVEGVGNALIDVGEGLGAYPPGTKVPLSNVARIVSTSGPGVISHENVQRKLVVSANVSGRDVGSVVADIRKAVSAGVVLPEGYRIEYGGQWESARGASRTLALATLLAILVIFLLLFGQFRDAGLAALVLATLPLALIGGLFAVRLSSGVVSIPSIIGFITLFGVATRNGVLLVSRYRHLEEEKTGLREAVIEGSVDRLNPILMTALTSALALIPLVLSGDKSGNEIQSPMAIVVLGGLITSTLLNIFIMPIMYEWFRSRRSGGGPKKSPRGLAAVLALLLLPLGARAQDFSAVLYSVEQHNLTLRSLRAQTDAVVADTRTGLTPADPEISAGYYWGNAHSEGNRVDLEVMQSFDFPTVYANKARIARGEASAAELEYAAARRDILMETESLCAEIVYHQALDGILQSCMESARELSEAYGESFAGGESNVIERNKARLAYLSSLNRYESNRVDLAAALADLSRLNGGEPVSLPDRAFTTPLLPQDFESLCARLKEEDPSLQLAASRSELSRLGVSLASSETLPKFRLGYVSERTGPGVLQGVGGGISIPLWENKGRVRAAKARAAAQEMTEREAVSSYEIRLRRVYDQALRLSEICGRYREALAGINSTEVLRKALGAGEISLVDYLVEMDIWNDANEQTLQCERDLCVAAARLRLGAL